MKPILNISAVLIKKYYSTFLYEIPSESGEDSENSGEKIVDQAIISIS
jgi:hypothetical protein